MLFFQYVGTAEACLAANDWQLLREVLGGEQEEVVRGYIQQLSQPGGRAGRAGCAGRAGRAGRRGSAAVLGTLSLAD
jgi:hypothetical protein